MCQVEGFFDNSALCQSLGHAIHICWFTCLVGTHHDDTFKVADAIPVFFYRVHDIHWPLTVCTYAFFYREFTPINMLQRSHDDDDGRLFP